MTPLGSSATSSSSPTILTRRVAPSYRPWTPEPYQLAAAAHLAERGAAALWLDPGMRKTSITLEAFRRLKATGVAQKMLVIAPRRVCQLVWRQETEKWTDFRDFKVTFLHGPNKNKLLRTLDSDIYLINPEGIPWLAKQYAMRAYDFPFDTVVIDEATKFKNPQAARHKALRPLMRRVQRKWALTGTPAPNGFMDLFGQFLIIDDGAALGKYITHFRDLYFSVGYDGFSYNLQPAATKRIEDRLKPYVFRLSGEDYLALPELHDNPIEVELDDASRKSYEEMKQDYLAELPGGHIEAVNAAAAYSKLKQMAGGAVYTADGKVQELHGAKLEALEELIESLGGQQLLLAYEFNHEMERLRASSLSSRITFLADARTDAAAEKLQNDWNAGRIEILACHPASAGHGLNLQESDAAHVCWWSPPWDLELWDQFVRRLRRSGNKAARITRHIFIVKNSIDEIALQAIGEKDTTQGRLLNSLRTMLNETGGAPASASEENGDTEMVAKLSREGATPVAPKGWGPPVAQTEPFPPQTERGVTQAEKIDAVVTGAENSPFSPEVAALRQALETPPADNLAEAAKPATRGPGRPAKSVEPAPLTAPARSPLEILGDRLGAIDVLVRCMVAVSHPDVHPDLFDPTSDKLLEMLKLI